MNATRDRTAWLKGGNATCRQTPPQVGRAWRLVLLGPPGAGKGTQANLLCHALGACPLSTGDVFRAARDRPASVGSAVAEAQACMARGELVPDELVIGVLKERMRCLHCRAGFMLDGFPRTLPQARALDALLAEEQLQLDAVIDYEVDPEVLVARLSSRWICPRCQAVFHRDADESLDHAECPHCHVALKQRPDDRPDAIVVRLEAYRRATHPLIDFYRAEGLLVPIRAEGDPVDILASTLDALALRLVAERESWT